MVCSKENPCFHLFGHQDEVPLDGVDTWKDYYQGTYPMLYALTSHAEIVVIKSAIVQGIN